MLTMKPFGTFDGREVTEAVLSSGSAEVSILNYGCVTRDWRVQASGGVVPVVLGFDSFDHYPEHSKSFGIIAGRVANRIANGRFSLNGQTIQLTTNEGKNHLHGGMLGLGRRLWVMETDSAENSVRLTYDSPDGEEGYPGAVAFKVDIQLDGETLTYRLSGQPDCATPINLAQHNYYNLDGAGDVSGHRLQLGADHYTPVAQDLIPTGEMLSVEGTDYDFRTSRAVPATDPDRDGIDTNLMLIEKRDQKLPAAMLESERSGLGLKLWTDQPAIQLFNAPRMAIPVPGIDGARYGAFAGVCLEPQHAPDSVNKSEWPSIIATPERPYYQELAIEISPI